MPRVFIFEKSSAENDASMGIATFGDSFFTRPDLIASYFNTADFLLSEATKQHLLSDFGLPLFYLQRHTTELILKKLYGTVESIQIGTDALGIPDSGWKSWLDSAQKDYKKKIKDGKIPTYSHDVADILSKSNEILDGMGFEKAPSEFSDLTCLISEFERGHPDRARYTTIRLKKHEQDQDSSSLPRGEEVVLELRKVQDLLKVVLETHMLADSEDDQSFFADLVREEISVEQRLQGLGRAD